MLVCNFKYRGAHCAIAIIIVNWHDDLSSNPEQGYLHFTYC